MSLPVFDQQRHLKLAAELSDVAVAEVVVPSDKQIVANGMRLHYLDWGNAGAEPIVFLHGGCLTAHTWDVVCLALRAAFRCLALDQRGHGDSEWSPAMDYQPATHAGDLRSMIRQLDLDQPVLVGHSLGGLSALAYAAEHSPELAGLVIVDVGTRAADTGARRITDFVTAPAELDSINEFVERALKFNPRRDRRLLETSLQHNLRRLPNGRWTWKYDPRPISRPNIDRLRREWLPALTARAAKIQCPVLVLRGAESDLLSDAGAAELAGLAPDGQWARIDGAGHTIQGDNPRALCAELRRFLAGLAR